MAESPTVLLIGESPPLGAPPDFQPFDCDSGDRLAKVIGLLDRATLLAHVPRANIFSTPGVGCPGGPKWDSEAARRVDILPVPHDGSVVTLGRRPAEAFGVTGTPPWGSAFGRIVVAPHPSGRGTVLNLPGPRVDARRYLLPEILAGCPGLRPWHFSCDRHPEVAVDLGAAICPHDPGLGLAAVRVTREVWSAVAVPTGEGGRRTIDEYRSTVDVSFRTVIKAAARGRDELAEALSRVAGTPERVNVARIRKELRWRSESARSLPEIRDYPIAVLRATAGRYSALGVW